MIWNPVSSSDLAQEWCDDVTTKHAGNDRFAPRNGEILNKKILIRVKESAIHFSYLATGHGQPLVFIVPLFSMSSSHLPCNEIYWAMQWPCNGEEDKDWHSDYCYRDYHAWNIKILFHPVLKTRRLAPQSDVSTGSLLEMCASFKFDFLVSVKLLLD